MSNVASFSGLSLDQLVHIYNCTDGVPNIDLSTLNDPKSYIIEQLDNRYNKKQKWAKTKFVTLG